MTPDLNSFQYDKMNETSSMTPWIWLTPSVRNNNEAFSSADIISPWLYLTDITLNLDGFQNNHAISSMFNSNIAKAIADILHNHSRLIIYLDEQLHESIQLLDWENVQLLGNPINSQVIFIRFANIASTFTTQRYKNNHHFFDLFPNKDWPSHVDTPKPFHSGHTAWIALNRMDLSQFEFITVFGHGDETSENLITLENGKDVHLEHIKNWPASLWLLTCGEHSGKHLKFIKNLIQQRQLKWALVSKGKINAEQALELHKQLHSAIHSQDCILQTLLKARNQFSELRNLVPVGNLPANTKLPEQQLIVFFNRQLSLLLLNKTSLSDILDQLYLLQNIKEYDAEKEQDLLNRIEHNLIHTPPLTKQLIVLPIAIYIAERSSHQHIDRFVREVNPTLLKRNENTIVGIAKGLLRVGKYIAALKILSQVDLSFTSSKDFDALMILFVICNDLHLITFNQIINQHLNLLSSAGELSLIQENKWSGTKAIFAYEQGRLETAYHETVIKYQKDISSFHNQTDYEIPELIYYGAQLSVIKDGFTIPQTYLDKAFSRLNNQMEIIKSTATKSGDNQLIKAIALWSWLTGEKRYENVLNEILHQIEEKQSLHQIDIGPLGFTKAFLLLLQNAQAEEWLFSPYRSLMIEKQYLLETAMLDYLFKLDEQAQDLLQQFELIRLHATNILKTMPVFNEYNLKITTSPIEWINKNLDLNANERKINLIKSGFFPN